jgi:hypothetical protein
VGEENCSPIFHFPGSALLTTVDRAFTIAHTFLAAGGTFECLNSGEAKTYDPDLEWTIDEERT